jgi:hypothetical protein
MDPFFRMQLILWLAILGAFGVHWFFMRDYIRARKQQQRNRDS